MSRSKIKVAAVGLLLVALVGVGGGIMIYRAMAEKPFAVEWERQGGLPVSNQQQVSYSPATPVSEDVPIPEDFSMSVPFPIALLPKYPLRDPERLAAYATSRSLPQGAVVVTDLPSDYQAAAEVFRSARAEAEKGELQLKSGCGLSVLAVGPLLMPYDGIEVRRLVCRGKRIEMEIAYTAIPPGKQWKVEVESWRPLVVVPLLLKAGSYRLETTWRRMDKLRDGKLLPVAPLVQTCSFIAPGGLIESPALRVHGVDFQTLVDGRCPVPEEGRRRSLHFGLRVTNRGDKELLFEPAGVYLKLDSLRAADGSPLRYGGGSDHPIVAKPVHLPAGRSHIFIVRGELGWFKDFQFQDGWYKGGTGLSLSGVIGSGDTFWYYDGLAAGKYRLCFDYHVSDRPESFWTGHVRTQDAEFEIAP